MTRPATSEDRSRQNPGRARLDSIEWQQAIAALLRSDDTDAICRTLIRAIDLAVDHEGTCLIAFHRDAPPEIVHHTIEPEGARHYLDRYLAGPYLLDPLYQLALSTDKPTLCRFREQSPDRFRSSEYYRQYCERTHLLDEMDFLVEADNATTLALVVGRRKRRFTKAELGRLRLIEPIVRAAMQKAWDLRSPDATVSRGDDELHRRLTECFETFGDGLLTDREREITQLLLRGHSAKSVARELEIAPGTVMVHKRNLFAKLGISSQFQLFSRFIGELSGR